MLRIAHADDHEIMRLSIAQFMLVHPNIMLVVQASSGVDLIEALKKVTADIVLTDWHMPGMDGNELVTYIREEFPQLPILVHSASDDSRTRSQALQAGATEFISKKCTPNELLKAILSSY